MTNRSELEDIRTEVLVGNTAQSVFKYLKELETLRERRQTRWIWELLQNARDVSTGIDDSLVASVLYNSEELVFLHNGRGFSKSEITHLIYHGSTKIGVEETIGKYGSGFLTTHLLSWQIDVSGKLDDSGECFDFSLVREPESVAALKKSMDDAWDNFTDSLSSSLNIQEDFTTRFVYPIIAESANKTVKKGIAALKEHAPFVVIFNPQFGRVLIKSADENLCFSVTESHSFEASGIQQIRATAGNSGIREYLLVQDEEALAEDNTAISVIVPFVSNETATECLGIGQTPRLFWGFPLVGTEDFSFPAVINSFGFQGTENRDGVPLAQGENAENLMNQNIIEKACALLIRLLQFAASEGWHHLYSWAGVPPIPDKDWINQTWLQTCLEKNLITEIVNTPVLLNEENRSIAPNVAMLPVAESDTEIGVLWDLLSDCKEYCDKLPRQQEVIGWCHTIRSWEGVSGGKISALSEAIVDGRKLVEIVISKWDSLESLQNELQENVCALDWLDRLYGYLKSSELFNNDIRQLYLFPDQKGEFKALTRLYRDEDIDTELKDIAELLEWPIRSELRDTRLLSIKDEVGTGNQNNDEIVQKLINKLRERTHAPLTVEFKKASVWLFTWLVRQEDFSRLWNFPVFALDGKLVLELPSNNSGKRPLAPFLAWSDSLQKFYDLFPADRILDNAFFEALPNKNIWKDLDERQLIRWDMTIRSEESDLKGLAPNVYESEEDEKEHQNTDPTTENSAPLPIPVTDIVERDAIMREVRNSRERGYLFWQFLTEWLVKDEVSCLWQEQASCTCGEDHEYYPVKWLQQVRTTGWIRDGDPRRIPNAKTLGKLLREKKWELAALKNPNAIQLLNALGIRSADLRLEIIAADEEKRNELVELATDIHADGINPNQIRDIMQDIKEDENLSKVIEDRRKTRRTWEQNQRVGKKVEDFVRQGLEAKGFLVKRINIGADFKIKKKMIETDTLTRFDINKDSQNWLVEVKSTRTESTTPCVRMSAIQAKTAKKKKERFLLCVVPLQQVDTQIDLETVKEKMLFIENIGDSIAPLCEDLEFLEEYQNEITTDTSDFALVVEEGKAGILVKKTFWDTEGFSLESLVERLNK